MLSKEGFCKALQMIKEQESIDEQFSKALNLVGDGHFVFGAENKYLMALRDVLKEAVNDQYDYIDWWLYRGTHLQSLSGWRNRGQYFQDDAG